MSVLSVGPKPQEPISTAEKPMGFLDHLEELRRLILKSLLVFLAGCTVIACFLPQFAKLMKAPLDKALISNPDLLQGLVTTSPMGIFSVLVQICFLGGLALAAPIMLFFMGQFLAPALTPKEKKTLLPTCLTAFVLFLIGASFSYFLVLPATLIVAMQLNALFGFQLIWSAPHYYGLVVWMTLGIGLCFEFPLILLALNTLGILSADRLASIRRYMIVGILVVGAAIIPGGDPLSLMLLATPLYASYEGVIWLGRRTERKKAMPEASLS